MRTVLEAGCREWSRASRYCESGPTAMRSPCRCFHGAPRILGWFVLREFRLNFFFSPGSAGSRAVVVGRCVVLSVLWGCAAIVSGEIEHGCWWDASA